MKQGKLLNLLGSFNKKELKSFSKYVRSPFFNENQSLVLLFDMLKPALENGNMVDKEAIWAKINLGKAYKDAEMRRLSSALVKLAEDFIVYKTQNRFVVEKQNKLLLGLNERDLEGHFEHALKNTSKAQETHPYRDANYYYNQYQMEGEYNLYLEKKVKRLNENNLEKEANNLDLFYLTSKLRLYCLFLNLQNVLAVDSKLLLMDEILSHLEEHPYRNVPVISIYWHILLTLREPEKEENYFGLKDLLKRYTQLFPPEENRIMYVFAQNYCIKQINSGKIQFVREIFELYKTTLQKELFFEKGYLTPWSYKNIVEVALRLNEFTWVEEFIQDYKDKIEKPFRNNAYTYNMARLHFARREFDKALIQLRQVVYNDIFYNLSSRSLLLMTYYELDEVEPLYSMMDSFRIFLRRNKLISDQHRVYHLNLIRFVKKATQIMPGDDKKLSKLKAEVKSVGQVASMTWLEEKLNQLGKSR